jgi:hypothetical protein
VKEGSKEKEEGGRVKGTEGDRGHRPMKEKEKGGRTEMTEEGEEREGKQQGPRREGEGLPA